MTVKSSIIVSTFNSPAYLSATLDALNRQKSTNFEVVVADDGSTEQTVKMLNEKAGKVNYPLFHAWHEDKGFRAAAARNNAVNMSMGDYLVFLDGDCLALPDFINRHCECAERGHFVRGSRVMLSEQCTRELMSGKQLPTSLLHWLVLRVSGKVNRIAPLLKLPYAKHRKATDWFGVKTCNLGMWRSDFEAVNGFDESYVGWGHEDADLAVRLIRNGVRRREGRHDVPVIHLWHPENSRDQLSANEERLQAVIDGDYVRAPFGLDRYRQ